MVTIFHVLFAKSFELLHVQVPVCHRDCSSTAHRYHLEPLTLELNRPTTMLKDKYLIHLRVLWFFFSFSFYF